ncbi:MAG: sulfatase-like hydrolase/transferase [Solirubrobacterales bacterium]|nr:sulfatase-like hydrolase/transferase [Solirubrobacterales bacterium]
MAVAGAATAAAASHGLAVNLDGRRNVVLIMIDTLRADHVGSYGASLMHTPNIDALAASGTQFDRVFPEAMPTVPARRSLLTGRRTFPFRDWEPWAGLGSTPGWEPIAPGTPTLVSELSRHGYATACVTDNPFLGFARAFRPLRRSFDRFVSIAGQVPRGPLPEEVSVAEARRLIPRNRWDELRHIEDMRRYLAANGGLGADIDESQTATGRVFATAQWLARRMLDQRPFLLMVDGFDPHEPWAAPAHYMDLYREPGDDNLPPMGDIGYTPVGDLTASELRRVKMAYRGTLTMVDNQVGKLLDTLAYLGLDSNTVVMLVSDHGFHLGERDWIGKSAWRLTPELTHVPMIVRDPEGRGAGVRSDWFANLHDVPATLTALAGARPSTAYEGADLSPVLDGALPAQRRDFTYGGYSNHSFVRDDRWAMVTNNIRSGQMLFDLEADPAEMTDVSRRHPDVVEALYERMTDAIGGDPPYYEAEQIDADPREIPRDW